MEIRAGAACAVVDVTGKAAARNRLTFLKDYERSKVRGADRFGRHFHVRIVVALPDQ